MEVLIAKQKGMRHLLYRSVWLPAIITAALLLVALTTLLATAWRSMQRLEPVHSHHTLVNRIEDIGFELSARLVETTHGSAGVDEGTLDWLRNEVTQVSTQNGNLAPDTPARLEQIRAVLADRGRDARARAIDALDLIRYVTASERSAHEKLLARVYRATRSEFEIAAALMVVLPLLAALALFLLRHRILQPLNNLRSLMTTLAQQNYSQAPTGNVDPMLMPLFENYNHLTARLAELERAREARRQTLENEVRAATQTLLEQQRNLANAERLAAVGEVAAGLAHELRNPLAGIQMSLGNLRNEITNPDQVERLNLVVAELKRLTHLLNDLLGQTSQASEPAREIPLARTVAELLTLARYQLPRHVRLRHAISEDLRCRLPEGRLRQALLNLVLNAADALGERPGIVTISAEISGQNLHLSVLDDGPGFPREVLEGGIRPFVTGREHGTGLGLAMVRRFARDLGGDLHVSNLEPHGARVTLILPHKELL